MNIREAILQFVQQNPGCTVWDICRSPALKYRMDSSSFWFFVMPLEKTGDVVSVKQPQGEWRFYPRGAK